MNYPILIGPRHAAQILGCHENTVRAWVKAGVLTDRKVEGTRFIRLDLAEVQAKAPTLGAPDAQGYTHTTQTSIPGYDVFLTVTLVPTSTTYTAGVTKDS